MSYAGALLSRAVFVTRRLKVNRQAVAAVTIVALTTTASELGKQSSSSHKTRLEEDTPKDSSFVNSDEDADASWKENNDDGSSSTHTKFDLTKEWERAVYSGQDFINNIIVTSTSKEGAKDPSSDTSNVDDDQKGDDRKDGQTLTAMKQKAQGSLLELISDMAGAALTNNQEKREQAIRHLIQTAREEVDVSSNDVGEDQTQSFAAILQLLQSDLGAVFDMLEREFGNLDLTKLDPTALYYFLEHEDERKNPSWKRRMHRFHRALNTALVQDMNTGLYLAELSYEENVDTILKGLASFTEEPLEMVYCETEAFPGKPAHFVALKKNQSVWSSALEVCIVVRGTSTMADIVTDALLEAVDYRGGKAHAGILKSGKWLVEKTFPILDKLRTMSGKRRLKVTLVGHSLGAGAASIAGMELNSDDYPFIDAEVIGFGCPSLVSEELSKDASSYVTTVVCDSDVVPRMSGASIANLLLDVMEFDWIPVAERDRDHALGEFLRISGPNTSSQSAPSPFSQTMVDSIKESSDRLLATYIRPGIKEATTERVKPVLFPPGRCVHFYRDGSGVSGSITPCTFFGEIDLTRRMIDDHYIAPGYRQIFLEISRQMKGDQYFRFDVDMHHDEHFR